jgi:hypothetical protein
LLNPARQQLLLSIAEQLDGWLLGTVSDRARREAQDAGWQLHEVPESRPVG